MKPVGEPYAGNPHVRFDERGWETERCRMAQATAPILDSTTPLTTDKGQQIMSADSAELPLVYFNSEMAIAFFINSFGAA